MDTNKIEQFRRKLRILEREVQIQLMTSTDCCGVSLAQCHAILNIGHSQETTIKDIAENLDLDKSTLSRTIDNLVNLGLVDRVINQDDRRFMKIKLTTQGEKVYNSINDSCNKLYIDMLSYIPEEKHDEVISNLGLLADAMYHYRKDTELKSCCK